MWRGWQSECRTDYGFYTVCSDDDVRVDSGVSEHVLVGSLLSSGRVCQSRFLTALAVGNRGDAASKVDVDVGRHGGEEGVEESCAMAC